MRNLILVVSFVIVGTASAYASGWMLLHVGQADGSGVTPPLTNLRITDTGAFRITDTAANRAVSP